MTNRFVFNTVRERSRDLASLLTNPDRIQAERRKAKDLRSQYGRGGGGRGGGRGGGGGGSSFRDVPASRPSDSYADRGGRGGGGAEGRSSGEVSDDWRAGYDRSPTPPMVDTRRAIGGGGGGGGGGRGGGHGRSESIDFDQGREGYSSRLTRYQEQERQQASQASHSRRCSGRAFACGDICAIIVLCVQGAACEEIVLENCDGLEANSVAKYGVSVVHPKSWRRAPTTRS